MIFFYWFFLIYLPNILVFINIGDKAAQIAAASFYISIALLVGLIVIFYSFKMRIPQAI